MNSNSDGRNGYVALYRGKRKEVYADTSYEAQRKAAKLFKAKREYEVTIVLCEAEDKPVEHNPAHLIP